MDLRDRLRLERPVLQAGMAGGLATAELAAAVSRGGGLGTIGLTSARRLTTEIRRARNLAPKRPIAANLLMPFTRPAHVEVCIAEKVDAVVLFFGFDRSVIERLQNAGIAVLHQVGTVDEARRAIGDGADAIVAQGCEAGGHLLGTRPALAFLPDALEAAGGRPVVLAGGIADAGDVRAALDAGASAVLCGTRFLLTTECCAHAEYKRRVVGAARTIETTLFALGWPARHRVVPNAATDRWCALDGRPRWIARALMAGTAPLARVAPLDRPGLLSKLQRVSVPLFAPDPLLVGADASSVEVTPLYAGACAKRIGAIVSAEDALHALAP